MDMTNYILCSFLFVDIIKFVENLDLTRFDGNGVDIIKN